MWRVPSEYGSEYTHGYDHETTDVAGGVENANQGRVIYTMNPPRTDGQRNAWWCLHGKCHMIRRNENNIIWWRFEKKKTRMPTKCGTWRNATCTERDHCSHNGSFNRLQKINVPSRTTPQKIVTIGVVAFQQCVFMPAIVRLSLLLSASGLWRDVWCAIHSIVQSLSR